MLTIKSISEINAYARVSSAFFRGSNISVSFILSLYLSFGLALYLFYFMIQLTIFFYGIFIECVFLRGYFHLVSKVVSCSN